MEERQPMDKMDSREGREGREERLRRMMREHGDSLVRSCALILKDASLAEDAVQESFVKAWKALPRFREECSELSWLTRICINTCRDYQRGFWFRRVDRRKQPEDLNLIAEDIQPQDASVAEAVLALPLKYREVILLRYYHDLPLKEIASALGLGVPTVSSRLIRAKEQLRESLKGWYFDEE